MKTIATLTKTTFIHFQAVQHFATFILISLHSIKVFKFCILFEKWFTIYHWVTVVAAPGHKTIFICTKNSIAFHIGVFHLALAVHLNGIRVVRPSSMDGWKTIICFTDVSFLFRLFCEKKVHFIALFEHAQPEKSFWSWFNEMAVINF